MKHIVTWAAVQEQDVMGQKENKKDEIWDEDENKTTDWWCLTAVVELDRCTWTKNGLLYDIALIQHSAHDHILLLYPSNG